MMTFRNALARCDELLRQQRPGEMYTVEDMELIFTQSRLLEDLKTFRLVVELRGERYYFDVAVETLPDALYKAYDIRGAMH